MELFAKIEVCCYDSAMSQLRLDIVIVHYNTPTLLRGCLESLRSCTVAHRIVVVDNASPSPEGMEMVRCDFPEVELIVNEENLGFARANNQGLRALAYPPGSGGSRTRRERGGEQGDEVGEVLLLNPDTLVRPNALETLVAFLEAHPRAGAVAPRLLNPDGSIQENAFRFPTLWQSFFDLFPLHGRLLRSRLNGRYQEMYGEQPFAIDHPLGACLLLRAEALEQVGLLDEGYFMYVEEVDLCYRIKRAGWKIYHVPAAQVVHYGGQSTSQMPERMLVELHRSRFRFFTRHYPPAFRFFHRLILRAGLRRRARRDRQSLARGELDAEALAARLAAYRQIIAMKR